MWTAWAGVCSGAPIQAGAAAQRHAEAGHRLAQAGDLKGAEVELRRAAELSPKDPNLLADLAQNLQMQGRQEEAGIYFDQALKLAPSNLAIRGNLAVTQWRRGLLTEAKANLEDILKANPGDKPTILLLGMVEENLKNYRRARELLASVPALVEERPESIAALARSYYQTGERKKARKTLNELQNPPAGPEGVFLGGRVALQAEDFETAETMFVSIRSIYPDTAKLGYNLALAQYRAHRLEESQATLHKLISSGFKDSEIYNLLGRCFDKQGNLKEALEAMERAIASDPSRESNYLDVGTILMEHHRLPEALVMAERAVEVAPTSYQAYSFKGLIETKMSKRTDAEKSYARAVEVNPAVPEAIMGLALAQWDNGKTQEAEATFKLAIEQFPHNANFYQEYGIMLLNTRGARDAATESHAASLLQTAAALDSSLAEPHYHLGVLALEKGRTREALQHLEQAAKLNPKSSKIHYSMARAYRQLGRAEEASKELRIYQNLKTEEKKSDSDASGRRLIRRSG